MATIVLNVPYESLVSKVKQICKMLQGVTSVKVERPKKVKEEDITKTKGYQEAMEDIELGRVKTASSVDDMFNQILGENWRNV